MSSAATLRGLFETGETVLMPDAYDPLSARIIQRLGFTAVQCSGFSMALSCLIPEPAFGFERNLAATRAIVQAVSVPVMADGEDGFADAEGVGATIAAYVEAGVAGINIEDQVLGFPGPKTLISREQAVAKLRAARAAAAGSGLPELILNGRTDALVAAANPEDGLREAILRANLYLEAGADLAFVVGAATLEQVRVLVKEIAGPVSIAAGMPYNMTAMSVAQLRELGVARVSLPSLAVFSAIGAMTRTLTSVRDTGAFEGVAADGIVCGMEDAAGLLRA